MPKTIKTLGAGKKRKSFSYDGSIETGVVLQQSGKPKIDAEFFREALRHFSGKTVYGGFKEDNPPPDGFGEWIERESRHRNSRKLTPRHGSFIAAILCEEAGVQSWLDGNSIVLRFPETKGLLPYKGYKWIVADPALLGGKLAVRGTRFSVSFVLSCLAEGMSIEEIEETYAPFPHEALPEIMKVASEILDIPHVDPLSAPCGVFPDSRSR